MGAYYCFVKTAIFSKNEIIRSEIELIRHFRELIEDEPELTWDIPEQAHPLEQVTDLEFRLDNRSIRFRPEYSLKPSEKEIESIHAARRGSNNRPLLVVPELNSRMLEFCRARGLAVIDLNGRVYIRAPNLLVDRRALPGRHFRYELEPRNVFVGKSARIVRSLLTDRIRKDWTQAELVERTKASAGLVSRIVQHLIAQGYADKTSSRTFRLSDVDGLVDAWIKGDDFKRRTSVARFNTFGDSPLDLARKLQDWATTESVPLAFTQWIAGWLRHPYTEPVITSAYVARLPDSASLEQLSLRPVNDVGKVWLFIPDDEGVFLETRLVNELNLASDAQIVVDLQGTGLRGPDQAQALRTWEGFCRP